MSVETKTSCHTILSALCQLHYKKRTRLLGDLCILAPLWIIYVHSLQMPVAVMRYEVQNGLIQRGPFFLRS